MTLFSIKKFSYKEKRWGFLFLLTILSIFGFINILNSTKSSQIGITPDSVNYIAAARSIVSGSGITIFNNNPLVLYPPLYPICLASIDLSIGIDPIDSVGIFNAILFGIIIYLTGLLIFKHMNSSVILSLLGTSTILFGVPLIVVTLLAMSEPLFILLVLVYLIIIELYIERQNLITLLILSFTVALACLTRYIGVFLIITGASTIILLNKNKISLRLKDLAVFVSISIIPITVYLIRNYFLSGTFAGSRPTSKFSLWQNISFTYNTILSWYSPKRVFFDSSIFALLLIIAGLLVVWIILLNRKKILRILVKYFNLISVIIIYLLFLIFSSTTVAYNTIGNRLLSPVFIPITVFLLILGLKAFSFLIKTYSHKTYRIIVLSAIIFLWVLLLFPNYAQISTPLWGNEVIRELGYNEYYWKENQTAKYFQKDIQPTNGTLIYSNEPYALYILTNIISEISPYNSELLNGLSSYKETKNILHLKGLWPKENNSYLVWFNRYSYLKPSLFKIEDLMMIADFQLVRRLDDGAVYLIRRK